MSFTGSYVYINVRPLSVLLRDLWQIHDEVVGVGFLGGSDDVLHGDARSTVAYVFSDGGGKQHRLLLHYPNERA